MNDDELLRGLKGAALRSEAKSPPEAPLGPQFEARVVEQIVRSQRAVKPRRALWIAAPLAAAAAIALWLARPTVAPAAPLPEYAMEITGGVDAERGATPSRVDVSAHAGDMLTILLRPATDVSATVEAHLLVPQGGTLRDVQATQRISSTGSVELRAAVADLASASESDVSATVVLTRPGLDPKVVAAPGAVVPAGARVIPLRVHVVR
jgi:hypothetical protein